MVTTLILVTFILSILIGVFLLIFHFLHHQSQLTTLTATFNSDTQQVNLSAPEDLLFTPNSLSITNTGNQLIQPHLTVNHVGFTTLDDIINTIFQDIHSLTPKRKALALWQFVSNYLEHSRPALQTTKTSPLHSPIVAFNQFGYS